MLHRTDLSLLRTPTPVALSIHARCRLLLRKLKRPRSVVFTERSLMGVKATKNRSLNSLADAGKASRPLRADKPRRQLYPRCSQINCRPKMAQVPIPPKWRGGTAQRRPFPIGVSGSSVPVVGKLRYGYGRDRRAAVKSLLTVEKRTCSKKACSWSTTKSIRKVGVIRISCGTHRLTGKRTVSST